MFLLGRYKKSNRCTVCPPGRMTTPFLSCPSSWPVSTLLRNSEFPARGVTCFHLSFAVVVGWPSRGSWIRDPSGMEGALLCTLQAQVSCGWLPVLHPDLRGEDCQAEGLAWGCLVRWAALCAKGFSSFLHFPVLDVVSVLLSSCQSLSSHWSGGMEVHAGSCGSDHFTPLCLQLKKRPTPSSCLGWAWTPMPATFWTSTSSQQHKKCMRRLCRYQMMFRERLIHRWFEGEREADL